MRELTPTMVWARANNHKTHPALQETIEHAKPLVARGLWALAVASAFDAGVQAEREGKLPCSQQSS